MSKMVEDALFMVSESVCVGHITKFRIAVKDNSNV